LGKVPNDYLLQVYDRSGTVIFKSNAINQRWNGYFNGRLQPSGVFVYLVNYKDMQQKTQQQKGTFVLIR
jgi:gliding motility-associated-like protein